MTTDPRLQNVALLTLAAFRIQQRRLTVPRPHWSTTEGLASLLDAAKALPTRSPWDLPDVDDRSALGRMLAEARRWTQQERGDHDPHRYPSHKGNL